MNNQYIYNIHILLFIKINNNNISIYKMYDKKTIFEYHKYLRDNNSNISFTTWSKKNTFSLDDNNNNLFDNDLTEDDLLHKIYETKNKSKGTKLIYKLLTTYYKVLD